MLVLDLHEFSVHDAMWLEESYFAACIFICSICGSAVYDSLEQICNNDNIVNVFSGHYVSRVLYN